MKFFKNAPRVFGCAAFAFALLLGATAGRADEGLNALYQKAKAEGKVVMYTSVPTFIVDQWRSQFEARYPGVKLEYFRSGTARCWRVYDAEKSAGQLHGDMVWVADARPTCTSPKRGCWPATRRPDGITFPSARTPGATS